MKTYYTMVQINAFGYNLVKKKIKSTLTFVLIPLLK